VDWYDVLLDACSYITFAATISLQCLRLLFYLDSTMSQVIQPGCGVDPISVSRSSWRRDLVSHEGEDEA
jgi:hypothetical protein